MFKFDKMEELVIGGKYQHYKGGLYKLICQAKLEDTLEDVIIYQALYHSEEFGKEAFWVRKKDNFFENVNLNKKWVPRFRYIKTE